MRAEEDFPNKRHSGKDQEGRGKSGRTESENGELSGQFMELNTVERPIKTEIDTRTEFKKKGVGKLGWFMFDMNATSPPGEGEPAVTV